MCQKNVFDDIWNENLFWRAKFNFWEPSGTSKHQISGCQQHGVNMVIQKTKKNDLCSHFSVPGRTIWGHLSIDLGPSCSEHFFPVRCGSYSVPNDLICFDQFSQFLRFHRFCDFAHFLFFSPFFNFWKLFYPFWLFCININFWN